MNISFIVADRDTGLETFCNIYNVSQYDVLINNVSARDVLEGRKDIVSKGTTFLVPPSSLTHNFRLVCDNVVYPHRDVAAERTVIDALKDHAGKVVAAAGFATISKAHRYIVDPKARSTINIRNNTVLLRRDTTAEELLKQGCFDFGAFTGTDCIALVSGREDPFSITQMLSKPPSSGRGNKHEMYVRGTQWAPNKSGTGSTKRTVTLAARKVQFKRNTSLPARKYQPDAVMNAYETMNTKRVGSLTALEDSVHDWVMYLAGQEFHGSYLDDDGCVYIAPICSSPTDPANEIGRLTKFGDKALFTLNSDLPLITMFSGPCPHKTEVLSLDFLANVADRAPPLLLSPSSPKRARTSL